jgi:hypothetical protein
MPNPQRENDVESDPNRSGARRIAHDVRIDQELPPTPHVVANRARIVTGRYAIVTPSQTRSKPGDKR